VNAVDARITPALVEQMVAAEEIPARRRLHAPVMVEEVLRFGGVIGSRILYHERLERGMAVARRLVAEHEAAGRALASGTVIVAATMTGARGRFDRSWHAPAGGIWLTLVLADTLLDDFAALYSVAAGVAVCELLRDLGIPAAIRWVNDVLVAGRKVAGILVEEERSRRSGERYVFIGIGINLNNRSFPPELEGLAVAAAEAAGRQLSLVSSTARLLATLRWHVGLLHWTERAQLAGDEAVNPLIARYRQLCDTVGRRVRFGFDVVRRPQYTGRVLAIDDDGALVLRLDEDGTVVRERAGELIYLDDSFP